MSDILAFTIFVLIFTIGEYVAVKTKANVDVGCSLQSFFLLVSGWGFRKASMKYPEFCQWPESSLLC